MNDKNINSNSKYQNTNSNEKIASTFSYPKTKCTCFQYIFCLFSNSTPMKGFRYLF